MGIGYNPSIVTNGLVLCLDARNVKSYPGTGTTCSDLSGNGNHGTLVNGPTYADGSFSTDGVDDYITCGNNSSLDIRRTITMSAWIYPLSLPPILSGLHGWSNLIGKGLLPVTARTYSLWYREDGVLYLAMADATGQEVCWSGTGVLTLNAWKNVVAVIDRSNGVVKLYVNGAYIVPAWGGTVRVSDSVSNTNSLLIGTPPGTSVGYTTFNCKLGPVSLYNRVLTASEVSQNFNALRGRFGI